jgi:hypothetical protein
MPDQNLIVNTDLFYAVLICAAIGMFIVLCVVFAVLCRVFGNILTFVDRVVTKYRKSRVDSYVRQEVDFAFRRAEQVCEALAVKYHINECDHMMHAANACLDEVRRVRAEAKNG